MENRDIAVAIIGAGTAGLTAYNAARKHTDDILLIEGGPYGTTCARVGCMPSKLLIAAAESARAVEQGRLFGIRVENYVVDGAEVLGRVRRERDRFVASVLKSVEAIPEIHKLRGHARFVGPRTLMVGKNIQVNAGRIILATGASPHVPDELGDLGDRLLVNDSLFELDSLPASIAVFGCGVVGLELGQALNRLGVSVRMFGRGGSLGGIVDLEIKQYAEQCLNDEYYLDTRAEVKDLSRGEDGVHVTFVHREKGEVTETFDYVLAATGRRPNLGQLALEKSGLSLDEKGVPITDVATLQCGDSPVFLVGDANNQVPFLHEAAQEGRVAGDNAGRFPDVVTVQRQAPFSIVFSDPQIARVGLLPGEMSESESQSYMAGRCSFESQGRSRVIGKNRGLLKVYADRGNGLFTGAEMFGPAAEHIGHLLGWAAQQGLTVAEMLTMPFYHPVIEEGVRTALKDCRDNLEHTTQREDPCLTCGPGN